MMRKVNERMHTPRTFAMRGVPVCGITANISSFRKGEHSVDVVFASSVPMIDDGNLETGSLGGAISKIITTRQYYGALRFAANIPRVAGKKTKVVLPPLGRKKVFHPWKISWSLCHRHWKR